MSFLRNLLARWAEQEEGRLFLWLPVLLAVGIGGYFSLPFEPGIAATLIVSLFLLVLALVPGWFNGRIVIPVIIVMLVSGFALAKLRTEMVRAPVLGKEKGFYELEGQIERIVLLPGGEKRLYLGNLSIRGVSQEHTPERIRLTSRMNDGPLAVGMRIRLKALLRPPPGPVQPGGFDFSRQAWFLRLGAVGFAISKASVVKTASLSPFQWRLWVEKQRQAVARKITDVTGGPGGAIALALIVGDKYSIDGEVMAAIRASGLAHMLAISGMHMALVSGTMFWILRALLALSQTLALRYDVGKIAATGAIIAALGYYFLSGMGISTLRAFIMITIMFAAVLLGRKALSMRNVALAALLILIVHPESLLSVGFQMSFASVVALVSFYERGIFPRPGPGSGLLMVRVGEKAVAALVAIFLTTLIAGLAVMPIAVYHFHHVTPYSVVGNVLAMPVLGMFVMPMALVSLLAMPFDLHAVPLGLMVGGNNLIVAIAGFVAGFREARINVGTMDLSALLLFVLGGLWFLLWRSKLRLWGLLPVVMGLLLFSRTTVPLLIVEREGKNIVLIDENKMMWPMSRRAGTYSLDRWQSTYGARRYSQTKDRKSGGGGRALRKWRCDQLGCTILHKGLTIAYSIHPGALEEDCARADILVAAYPVFKRRADCGKVRIIMDIRDLKKSGAVEIRWKGRQPHVITSAGLTGRRPWSKR